MSREELVAALGRIEQDAGWLHDNVPGYSPDGVATLRDICRQIAKEAAALAALDAEPEAGEGALDVERLAKIDEQASIAHDFIWPQSKAKPTRNEASDAIWRIHEIVRPVLARLRSEDPNAQ